MKKWAIILILLVGCGKELPDANLSIETNGKKFTQIEAKPIKTGDIPNIGGKDKSSLIAIYTVPASSVTTTIYVYDDIKKPFRPRSKGEAKKPVSSVATSQNVKASYPEITPWWYWWIAYIVCAAVVYYIGKKYVSIFTKPIGWVKKIYEYIKR